MSLADTSIHVSASSQPPVSLSRDLHVVYWPFLPASPSASRVTPVGWNFSSSAYGSLPAITGVAPSATSNTFHSDVWSSSPMGSNTAT